MAQGLNENCNRRDGVNGRIYAVFKWILETG